VSLERQVRAMIRVAEEYRAERCQALLETAALKAKRIMAQAHAAARSSLRAALTETREELDVAIAEAETELVSLRRVDAQRRLAAALDACLPALQRTLRGRWQSPSGRTAWVRQHLAVAIADLPSTGWRIHHAPGWPPGEREETQGWLRNAGIGETLFEPDPGIEAGIRVRCGPNLLDASFDGLLADRALINGRLLHYLQEIA